MKYLGFSNKIFWGNKSKIWTRKFYDQHANPAINLIENNCSEKLCPQDKLTDKTSNTRLTVTTTILFEAQGKCNVLHYAPSEGTNHLQYSKEKCPTKRCFKASSFFVEPWRHCRFRNENIFLRNFLHVIINKHSILNINNRHMQYKCQKTIKVSTKMYSKHLKTLLNSFK